MGRAHTQQEDTARSRASEAVSPADTLTFPVEPLALWESQFLLFKPPGLWPLCWRPWQPNAPSDQLQPERHLSEGPGHLLVLLAEGCPRRDHSGGAAEEPAQSRARPGGHVGVPTNSVIKRTSILVRYSELKHPVSEARCTGCAACSDTHRSVSTLGRAWLL